MEEEEWRKKKKKEEGGGEIYLGSLDGEGREWPALESRESRRESRTLRENGVNGTVHSPAMNCLPELRKSKDKT
ncbi:hypothetical protein M5K25_000991 [Dendrobium thyrsiflorum]|uniref:Uncharacterized protein n=1 Tax=Dendrobium thyrsiflorum TaxID=117978 RepID=A0ABD0W862_DENTH